MAAEETAALSISLVALLLSFGYFMNCICNYPKRCTLFLLTFRTPYSILYLVCKTCASGSAVEHLLAKEGVAGSIPVSRLKKERYQIGIVLFFEPCQGSKVRCLRSAPVRAVRGPPDLVRRLALVKTRISAFMVHKI